MSGEKHIDRICVTVMIVAVAVTLLLMNGERLGLVKRADADSDAGGSAAAAADNTQNAAGKDREETEDTADMNKGIPAVFITIDPEEYQKVIESREHKYKAYDGELRIELPEGYESEFGEIDPKTIGAELPLEFLRGRGNSTWLADKKSFKLKLERKTDILGMGKSKTWALISNAYDPSLLRNRVMLELGRMYGLNYTSKCLSVDLYINGECQGNYLLSQTIRIGKAEVDIDEIPSGAKKEPEISGGYLVAMNPYPKEKTNNTFTTERGVRFRLKDPIFEAKHSNDSVGTQAQRDYITGYLQSTENAIFGEDLKDENGVPWTDYMDMESTAKYWWHQQLCEDSDAYRSDSTDLYKERNGKLFWGPPWDYDIALDPITYNGSLNSISMTWIDHLRANDPEFQQALLDAWEVLDPLLEELTEDGGVIDCFAAEIADSWVQDNEIRHTDSDLKGTDLETQIIELKHFINRKREAVNAGLDRIGEVTESSSQPQSSSSDSSSEDQEIPGAQADDIASGISGTCYWRIDSAGHMTIGPLDGLEGTLDTWANANQRPWHQKKSSIESVSFEGTVHAQTCLAMFYNCYYLSEIDLTGLDTSQVTTMRGMFAWCWNLEELDVSGLDFSAATTMREMFLGCNGLTSLDLSALDLSGITDMRYMFERCHQLKSILLPETGFSSVQNMNGMFADCFALESLDMSAFDTSNVTSMRALFYRCSSLPELDLSRWNTSNVTAMDYMFAECSSLTSLNLKNFDTTKVTDMSCMFLACSNLTELDLTSFDTSAAESMYCMFGNCVSLKEIKVGDLWQPDLDSEDQDMFHGCTASLTS